MRHRGVVLSLALVLLLTFAALAAPAGAQPPAHGRAGRWIVVLEDGQTPPGQVAADHARGDAASVSHVYDTAIRGYAASMSSAALARARRDARVAFIEPDYTARAFHHGRGSHGRRDDGGGDDGGTAPTPGCDGDAVPWGVDRVGADENPSSGVGTGECDDGPRAATIYVLDTGATSPDLNVVEERDYVGDGVTSDCDGHGTHVAGTAAARDNDVDVVGVAAGAPVAAFRVLDCRGLGSYSGIIAAIDEVAGRSGKRVVNLSLGGDVSSSLDRAIVNAVDRGVFFAVAAGNSNANACNYSPARVGTERGVVTVGATTSTDTKASFSNHGRCVQLWAPGVSIPSSQVGGGTTTLSGTSMASPHVAGAAALWLATHDGSPAQVERALVSSAEKLRRPRPSPLLDVRSY